MITQKNFFHIIFSLFFFYCGAFVTKKMPFQPKKSVTIMFHSIASYANPGRHIGDFFERGLVLQFINLLKQKMIEALKDYDCTILISNSAGKTTSLYEQAMYANQQEVNLFVAFSLYWQEKPTGHVSLFSYTNSVFINSRSPDLAFVPLKDAYVYANQMTKKVVQSILKDLSRHAWLTVDSCSCPFIPLQGIMRPACAIELAINDSLTIQTYLEPICHALAHAIELTCE
jgi:hypothetical protein